MTENRTRGTYGDADKERSSRSSRASGEGTTPSRDADQDPAQRELLAEGKLYYRIGEVSRITGIKPHVLRYWETEFRWMAPPKSRSKQRLYRRKDIEMVLAIKNLLYDERYTIAGARQVIRDRGVAKLLEDSAQVAQVEPVKAVDAQVSENLSEDLPESIRGIRSELLALRALLA